MSGPSAWRSHGSPGGRAIPPHDRPSAARSTPLPKTIALQLARLSERAPEGAAWLHEVKFDGYRVLLWRDGKRVRITSRGAQNWTGKLSAAVAAVRALPCTRCVLDGELVALDAAGGSSFQALQQTFGNRPQDLTVMVFDLLYLDGKDLRAQTQLERKQALQRVLGRVRAPLRYTDHIVGHGAEAAKRACAEGLEGIISKRVDAPYEEGRGGAWLKIKCVQSEEYAVVGYTRGKGARASLGSLLLGRPAAGKGWHYVGRVGTGMDDALLRELGERMRETTSSPLSGQAPTRARLRGASPVWIRPELVVEVEFRGLTADGLLRQASLKGLRKDRSVTSLRPGRRDHARISAGKAKVKRQPSNA